MATNISTSALLSIGEKNGAEVNNFFQHFDGVIKYIYSGCSTWHLLLTILLLMATYDQGKFERKNPACKSKLRLSQARYIKQKGTIAGPAFKIPFMGPFIQALHPKFDSYLAQWASGPLSCVSVFHK
jgi:C-22 sterol desaturase